MYKGRATLSSISGVTLSLYLNDVCLVWMFVPRSNPSSASNSDKEAMAWRIGVDLFGAEQKE